MITIPFLFFFCWFCSWLNLTFLNFYSLFSLLHLHWLGIIIDIFFKVSNTQPTIHLRAYDFISRLSIPVNEISHHTLKDSITLIIHKILSIPVRKCCSKMLLAISITWVHIPLVYTRFSSPFSVWSDTNLFFFLLVTEVWKVNAGFFFHVLCINDFETDNVINLKQSVGASMNVFIK